MDGKRCLIKGGSGATQQEPHNEVLASSIMKRLDIPHVEYSLLIEDDYPYSVCEDFITPDTDLISAWHLMQTVKSQIMYLFISTILTVVRHLEFRESKNHLTV